MGDDDTVVVDRINAEMIDLGNMPDRYSLNKTLDKFLPNYYIKRFLANFLDATYWDSESANVEKLCYKGCPGCQLPNRDKFII